MNTIIDEGIEFEVIWDGAHQGRDADLFRQPEFIDAPPVYRPLPAEERGDYRTPRQTILDLLEKQPVWETKELRAESGVPHAPFWAVLQTLRVTGKTVHPERGVVALIREQAAA